MVHTTSAKEQSFSISCTSPDKLKRDHSTNFRLGRKRAEASRRISSNPRSQGLCLPFLLKKFCPPFHRSPRAPVPVFRQSRSYQKPEASPASIFLISPHPYL